MTADELAQMELKVLTQLKDVDEEEKNKIAAEKMKTVVSKMIREKDEKQAQEYQDEVQLGVEGWKMRYYTSKFHITEQDFEEFM